MSPDTFNQSFGPWWRDNQHAASSFFEAHSFVQSGHAKSSGVYIRGTGTGEGKAVAGLASC